MFSHKPSRYGSEMLIIRSDQCQATDAGAGAAIHFQRSRPIVAPHGTRLLISLRQATYSKSIANCTQGNNQISFKYDDDTRVIDCTIATGLYSTGERLAVAVQAAITDATLAALGTIVDGGIEVTFDEVTAHFTFTHSGDGGPFEIVSSTTTAGDLLGLDPETQFDVSMTSVESLYAADLAPCSAFLVQTDLSCHAIEAQG